MKKLKIFLLFVFFFTVFQGVTQNTVFDRDSTQRSPKIDIDSLVQVIRKNINQVADYQLFDKALQTRKLGKNRTLVDSMEVYYDGLGIDFMTISNMNNDEFWARAWSSKKAYGVNGKIDTAKLDNQTARQVIMRIKIDSVSSMKDFKIRSTVAFSEPFKTLLSNYQLEGLETEINTYLASNINHLKAVNPSEFRVPVQSAMDWMYRKFLTLPEELISKLNQLKKQEETIEQSWPHAYPDFQVVFTQSSDPNKTTFGFDKYNETYTAWESNYQHAKTGGNEVYYIPHASNYLNPETATSAGYVLAEFKNNRNPSITLDSLTFKDMDGETFTPDQIEQIDPTHCYIALPNGGRQKEHIVAYHKNHRIGKLKVFHYNYQERRVNIVPVGFGLTNADELTNALNQVYAQSQIKWQLEIKEQFTPESELFARGIEVPTGEGVEQYSDQMRALRREYFETHPEYEKARKQYLIFVVNSFTTSEGSTLEWDGFMPRGKGMGFVTRSAISDGKTLAHELAHGAFGLEHTWHEGGPAQGRTTNLMDYTSGPSNTTLTKAQWDEMNRRLPVLSYKDDSENAASSNGVWGYVFLDPSGRAFKLPIHSKVISVVKNGCLLDFFSGDDDTEYRAKIVDNKFYGYYSSSGLIFPQETLSYTDKVLVIGSISSIGGDLTQIYVDDDNFSEGDYVRLRCVDKDTPDEYFSSSDRDVSYGSEYYKTISVATVPNYTYSYDGENDINLIGAGEYSSKLKQSSVFLWESLLKEKCKAYKEKLNIGFRRGTKFEIEVEEKTIILAGKNVTIFSVDPPEYKLKGDETALKQKYNVALTNDYDLSTFTIIEDGKKITRSADGTDLEVAPITPAEIEAIKIRLKNGETNGDSEALYIVKNQAGKTEVYVGYKKFTRAGWDDKKRIKLQEEQQTKVNSYLDQRTAKLEQQRAQEESGTFKTDGSKTIIMKGSYLETLSGIFKQTGQLLSKAKIPESVYDSESNTYPKGIIHTSPYGCGIGNGAIEEFTGTADAVVAIGGLVTDLALDEQKREDLVEKFSNLSFDDVKKFVKNSAASLIKNVEGTSDKNWHSKGKMTTQVAAIFIPFSGGFKALDKFGEIVQTFDGLAAKASKSFIGPRQSLKKKFDALSDSRAKELVDEDALDGFVTKLSDDAVGDVAKKKDLIDALSLDNVSAEEFSIFGKLANDNPKLLTKEYFEEVRGILKHKDGEKLVNSWKKIDKLNDNAFAQLKKDPDFLKRFGDVIKNDGLNKHAFQGDIKVKTNPDGTLKYEISGIHSNKAFADGTVRIKPSTEIEDLGDGFYKAKVEKQIDGLVNDQGTNWKVKKNKSTFFPDSWSTEKIQAEIAHAFNNKKLKGGNKYEGFTTGGKKITMFLDEAGKIKTAFPDL